MITKEKFLEWMNNKGDINIIENNVKLKGYSVSIIESITRYKISFTPNNLYSMYRPFSIDTRFVDEEGFPCRLDSIVKLYVIALDEFGCYAASMTIDDIKYLSKVINTMIGCFFITMDKKYCNLSGEVVF